MPEGDMSTATRRMKLLMDALRYRVAILKREMGVPFGYESVTPGEYKRRWAAMTAEQRAAEMQKPNWREVQDLLLR